MQRVLKEKPESGFGYTDNTWIHFLLLGISLVSDNRQQVFKEYCCCYFTI